MKFLKYQHIVGLGDGKVRGIENGRCYVFPKIDGTNASIWMGKGRMVCAGSRRRELSLGQDNAGFLKHVLSEEKYLNFLKDNHTLRLFGEWLVPHSLKTYRESAWREFYVFDVMCGERYLEYEGYKPLLEKHNINYIPPICVINSGTKEQFIKQLDKNDFLIEDGKGRGEGIVIKNYSFVNSRGRTVWAKIVTSEFKKRHKRAIGAPNIEGAENTEVKIVDMFLTKSMIEKVYANLSIDGFSSSSIPRLLKTCFHDLVEEECWNFVKKMKEPTVDFKLLRRLAFEKVKSFLPEIF